MLLETNRVALTQLNCFLQLQSVSLLVVVVFITAAARPTNSTRVITCCTSSQSRFDHQNHSHHTLSVCAQQQPTQSSSFILVTDTQSHSMQPQCKWPAAPSRRLPSSALVSSRSGSHPRCIQHRSRQRHACLSHNQSCSVECYTGRAAGSIRYMRAGSHSWESHLPKAPSQLPSFILSRILLATQRGLINIFSTETHIRASSRSQA